ncbi:MAG: cytidylate kinase-like family protein [Bacteroidales bacterium]|nr:cytidylate kinase-like family protein [Bacteroidales bacterium]
MTGNYVITIGRQLGSGGREIGQKLSALLGISFYDKELICLASRESGLNQEFFEKADERKRFRLFGGISGFRDLMAGESMNQYLADETLFKIQSDIIRSLAAHKSCIFVGRCADYVLKDTERRLSIFIYADLNDRIKRVTEIHKMAESKAKIHIERTDRERARYYNYFSGKEWGAAASYHLCINSSVLGIDKTADLICRFAGMQFGLE